MGSETVVFGNPAPMGVDHLGTILPESYAVLPVVLVVKFSPRPV
jgi:hypothetical protein